MSGAMLLGLGPARFDPGTSTTTASRLRRQAISLVSRGCLWPFRRLVACRRSQLKAAASQVKSRLWLGFGPGFLSSFLSPSSCVWGLSCE
jgi:hypothetical protein